MSKFSIIARVTVVYKKVIKITSKWNIILPPWSRNAYLSNSSAFASYELSITNRTIVFLNFFANLSIL
jgi:hypothetical protein